MEFRLATSQHIAAAFARPRHMPMSFGGGRGVRDVVVGWELAVGAFTGGWGAREGDDVMRCMGKERSSKSAAVSLSKAFFLTILIRYLHDMKQ